MNNSSKIAMLGVGLIIAGAPAIASAATAQSAPISLDRVQINQSYGTFDDFLPGNVTVGFTNNTTTAVTKVVFNLVDDSGNILAQYRDAGSYAHGASIRHSFPDTHAEYNQHLDVAQVDFADGTSWSAPANGSSPAVGFPAE
jgi:hypothetical protein